MDDRGDRHRIRGSVGGMYSYLDDEPYLDRSIGPLVTHLTFVDGRLVETRQEPAAGTEWSSYVRPPAAPSPPPPPPLHQQVEEWLVEVCGSRAALDELATTPLDDDSIDLPVEFPLHDHRLRMEATADQLDLVAARMFDAETSFAFRHALLAIWVDDPEAVLRASTPGQLAGGICWAVAKANGLLHPIGTKRVGAIQEVLDLRSPLSAQGNVVAATLRGFRAHHDRWRRPPGVPDLLPLGRCDVLLGTTRERLLRLRERARAAAA